MLLQKVKKSIIFFSISFPNISRIRLKTYLWEKVNLKVETQTKQIAFILSILVSKYFLIYYVILLSLSIPLESIKPGVSITITGYPMPWSLI